MPAPIPVVPTSTMTGTPSPEIVSNSGLQRRVVDAVAAHDRVEVEAEHAELGDRAFRLGDGLLALVRVDRSPGVDERAPGTSPAARHVVVGAGRRADDRLDVERDEHDLDPGRGELVDDRALLGSASHGRFQYLPSASTNGPCESIQGWCRGSSAGRSFASDSSDGGRCRWPP